MSEVQISDGLSSAEHIRLEECESLIERGLNTFVEVGQALLSIRESRLYRAEHGTFEDYCQDRWGMGRRRANQLIEAAGVVGKILPTGLPAPAVESHAAELAKVPEGQRAEVWQRVVTETDGKPTAAAIREAVAPQVPQTEPPEPEPAASRPAETFQPPSVISAEEAEERRRKRVATDLLTDLVVSLSQLAGSEEFEYYTPDMAHPWPINAEMLDKAALSIEKTRTTLTRKGIL